jgi:hypothetical protein
LARTKLSEPFFNYVKAEKAIRRLTQASRSSQQPFKFSQSTMPSAQCEKRHSEAARRELSQPIASALATRQHPPHEKTPSMNVERRFIDDRQEDNRFNDLKGDHTTKQNRQPISVRPMRAC